MADDIGALLVQIKADISQLKSELQEGRSQLQSFQGSAQEFGSNMKSALKLAVGALGIYELGGALKNAFKQGVEAVNEFQLTTIGIAATLTDITKDQTDMQDNYARALSYSRDMYNELELAAAKFFASGSELVQAWNIMAQKGVVLHKEEINYLGIIVDRIKLSTSGQIQSMQIAQELRSIMEGQARATDQVARLLKDRLGPAWKDVVNEVRETGSFKVLADQFKGLAYAGRDIEMSLESQRSTLGTLLKQVGRGGLQDAYDDIVNTVKDINEYLRTHKDELIADIKIGWTAIKDLAQGVWGFVKEISNVAKKGIVIPITFSIGGLAKSLSKGAGALGDFGFGALDPNMIPEIKKARELEDALIGYGSEGEGHVSGGKLGEMLKGKGKGDKEGKDKSRVSAWQSELEEMKSAENAFFSFSKERELEFWREKLDQAEEGTDEYIQVKHRIFAAEKEIARATLKEQISDIKLQQELAKDNGNEKLKLQDEILKKLAATYGKESTEYKAAQRDRVKIAHEVANNLLEIEKKRIETQKELVKIDLDIARENLALKRNLGLITQAQEITELIALKKQEIALERESLKEKLKELEKYGKQYTKEYADILNKLKILEKKESLDLTKLNNQRMMALKAQWDQLWGSISRAFTQSLTGILQGTTTLADALKNIWQSILASFIEMILQMAMQWVAAQLFQLVFGKAAAVGKVGQEAAVSGAAGFASVMAAIPFPMNIALAPEVAAFAATSTLAYAALASAAGGWDVPADALTMVHKKEMVLPEYLADRVRGMTDGGGGGTIGAINLNFPNVKNLTRQVIRRDVMPEIETQLKRWGYKLGKK